jgi:iron complex transport system permease protein
VNAAVTPLPVSTSFERSALAKHQAIRAVGIICTLIILMLLGVAVGSVRLPIGKIIDVLVNRTGGDDVVRTIVWSVRLPRTITAMAAGGALSVAGLLMQTLFRNPLADASVLGVTSGAALGVAIVVLGSASSITVIGRYQGLAAVNVTIAAAIGSSAILAAILAIATRVDSPVTVLIAGLMVATLVGSIVSLLAYFSSLEAARSFGAWSLGSFRGTSWEEVSLLAFAVGLGLGISSLSSKQLDALLLGERDAASLGTNLRWARIQLIGAAAIMTGATTAFCGPIGFLGIAAPQLARSLMGTSRHRLLIPITALVGANIALACELIAQWPGDERVLPINAVTAAFGAPVVLWVLIRRRSPSGR